MLNDKIFIFALLGMMLCNVSGASAEAYNDKELASYIAGKINVALENEKSEPSKICTDDEGCVIVVY